LIDFVQVLDFFTPLVLLSEVTQVAVDLLFSLFDSVLDLASHILSLFLLHSVDLGKALLVVDLIGVYCMLFDRFFRLYSHLLHFLDLLHIFLQSILLLLLDFLILLCVKLIEMLIVCRSCLNSLCLLSFLHGEFLLDSHLVGHELSGNVALIRSLLLGCIVLLGGGQVSVLLVALELLF